MVESVEHRRTKGVGGGCTAMVKRVRIALMFEGVRFGCFDD